MTRLLVDDLVLVLLSPETARPVVDGQRLAPALAGALLMDLALAGRLDVTEGARHSGDKLAVRPGPPTGDALLDDAVTRFGPERRRARGAVQRLARSRLPREVLERLAAEGLVAHTPGGFLRFARNVPDASVRKQLVGELTAALTGPGDPGRPEERPAALVSLVHAVGAVPKVLPVPGMSRRELNRRAKEVSEGEWAGAAVLAAVRAAQAATNAAITAALASGSAAASS